MTTFLSHYREHSSSRQVETGLNCVILSSIAFNIIYSFLLGECYVTGTRVCNGERLKKTLYFNSPLLRHGYSTELRNLSSPKYSLSSTRPLGGSAVSALYLRRVGGAYPFAAVQYPSLRVTDVWYTECYSLHQGRTNKNNFIKNLSSADFQF